MRLEKSSRLMVRSTGSEVQVNAPLRATCRVVLISLVSCALWSRRYEPRILVRQANLGRAVTDLCTGLGKRVVIVSLDVADEVQF